MSKRLRPRINLHDTLKDGSFDHAVICTYTFDPVFFEQYALERFNALSNTAGITVLTDQSTFEEVINGQSFDRPKKANVRYLFHPIRVAGVFHPKLYLFANKRKGRLVIGSSNFTRPGIATNAELVCAFEFESEAKEHSLPLFRRAYGFLKQISATSGCKALDSNLSAIGREAPWILGTTESSDETVRFLHNLDEPLWGQIAAHFPSPVDSVDVLSLFFDAQPTLIDRVFSDLEPKRMRIFTENGRTTLTREWLDHPRVQSGEVEILFISVKDGGQSQPLHAKALYIEKDGHASLAYGSANFTSPALTRTVKGGNSEVILLLADLDADDISVERLFDPSRTARKLTHTNSLLTRTNEPKTDTPQAHVLHLVEAEVVDDKLKIDLEIPDTVQCGSFKAELTFFDGATASVQINHSKDSEYLAEIPTKHMKKLDGGSTTIHVVGFSGGREVASSNSILAINLLEFHTGQRLRRSRHLKEAQESAVQFFQVLSELLEGSDESALLVFFNMCDIPILEASRPSYLRHARTAWDGAESMRSLGNKNLKVYEELHEAALHFFDRHYRKLERHVGSGSANGVSNYLHIFFAMGGVLRSQIERLIQGLEAQDSPIDPHTWGEIRQHIDDYFYRARNLFICLDQDYLPKVAGMKGWDEIQNEVIDEFDNIDALRGHLLRARERLEEIRGRSLWVRGQSYKNVEPAYFSCIFNDENWERFRQDLEDLQELEIEVIA